MKTILTTLILIAAVTTLVISQSGNKAAEEEILKLEQKLDQASVKGDIAVMEQLLAEGYISTAFLNPPRSVTKSEVLARAKDADAQPYVIESMTHKDLRIKFYGDTAIVTGQWRQGRKAKDGKDASLEFLRTRSWVKINGHWQLVASHTSPILDLSKCLE